MSLESTLQDAIVAQRSGRAIDAKRLYRMVLQQRPDHPVANHNLGVLTAQGGDARGSLSLFEAALATNPDDVMFLASYARGLMLSGEIDECLMVLHRARERRLTSQFLDQIEAMARAAKGDVSSNLQDGGGSAEDFDARATHLLEQGAVGEAISLYREALSLDPGFADAHFHLASVLSESGQIAEGFAHYMTRAELLYGRPGQPPHGRAGAELPHKVKHDQEQREYLSSLGIDGPSSIFHIADGARVPGFAINAERDSEELRALWRKGSPRMLVIDDFLSPLALERLRRYCAGSTVWKRVYDAGYIGATPEDGFACPLLAQIAEEIQQAYVGIVGRHQFRYLGAFKYDSSMAKGTNIHADFSAVNVNLYITPDEANLDHSTGGMKIWVRRAASEDEMRRYNGDEAALCEMLEKTQTPAVVVAHRANRAVIFDSALYHRTDKYEFREGYLNKRINVSLLFGDFGADLDA